MLACIKETTGTISVKVCRMKYQDSTRFTRKIMQYQLSIIVGLTKNRLFFRYSTEKIFKIQIHSLTNLLVFQTNIRVKGMGIFHSCQKLELAIGFLIPKRNPSFLYQKFRWRYKNAMTNNSFLIHSFLVLPCLGRSDDGWSKNLGVHILLLGLERNRFCLFNILLTVHTLKSTVEISQNFVAFSEHMNFNWHH